MAASTWFHGSAWPPGNHGIMPLGSCQSAMASTVAGTSAAGEDALDLRAPDGRSVAASSDIGMVASRESAASATGSSVDADVPRMGLVA